MVPKAHCFIAVTQLSKLAEKSSFLEVAYLLLKGELPTQTQFDEFSGHCNTHTMLHQQMVKFFDGFRRDAHPMAIVLRCSWRDVSILPRFN